MSIATTSRGGAFHWNGNRGLGLIGCDGSRCRAVFDAIRAYHMANGWVEVAYNHLRCPGCGRTFTGRGWGARSGANGTSAANREWHAWMVMYGGNEPLTLSAKTWLHEMNAEHRRRYGRSRLTTHRAVRGGTTECPGPEGLAWIAAGAPLTVEKDDDMTPEQDKMLRDVHRALGGSTSDGVRRIDRDMVSIRESLRAGFGWLIGSRPRPRVRHEDADDGNTIDV